MGCLTGMHKTIAINQAYAKKVLFRVLNTNSVSSEHGWEKTRRIRLNVLYDFMRQRLHYESF